MQNTDGCRRYCPGCLVSAAATLLSSSGSSSCSMDSGSSGGAGSSGGSGGVGSSGGSGGDNSGGSGGAGSSGGSGGDNSGSSGGSGGDKKNKYMSQHSWKMAGFAKAMCGDGEDQAMVSIRAEHHSGNYNRYGTRGITGVPDSGGPPAIHDNKLAKLYPVAQ